MANIVSFIAIIVLGAACFANLAGGNAGFAAFDAFLVGANAMALALSFARRMSA